MRGRSRGASPSPHRLRSDCCLTVRGQQNVSPIPTAALDLTDLLSPCQFSCLPLSSHSLLRCLSFHILKKGNLSFPQLLLLVTQSSGEEP